jgi:hypothetical protein
MGDGTLAQQPIENGIYGAGTRVPFGPWAWFETEISYERRAEARRSKRLLRRAIREAKAQAKLGWVDTLLRSLGPSYTELGYGWPALLDVLVPQVATGKMLDEICKIPWDADAEHVAKLKAELKAQSDAGMHYDDCDCWGCVPE